MTLVDLEPCTLGAKRRRAERAGWTCKVRSASSEAKAKAAEAAAGD